MFFIGVAGVIVRRNPLIMLMSIELMFNAANLLLHRVRARVGAERRPRLRLPGHHGRRRRSGDRPGDRRDDVPPEKQYVDVDEVRALHG